MEILQSPLKLKEKERKETKIQIPKQEHQILHPRGSSPGNLYTIAGLLKIGSNGHVNQLPIRYTISDTGTATFELAKHLPKIISPLQIPNTQLKK